MFTTLQTKLGNKLAGSRSKLFLFVESKVSGRDQTVLLNVLFSLSYKVLSVLLALAVVPLSIHYLDTERYGIWITLSSMLSWINLMDIGLGNGLRNQLAKALSDGNHTHGRTLVSTTYALVAAMVILLLVVASFVLPRLDLQAIFNSHRVSQAELLSSVSIAFLSFCLLFVLKPLTAVIMATQRASFDNLIILVGNGFGILGVMVLNHIRSGHGSLLELVTVFSIASPVAYLLGSFYIYRIFPQLTPSIRAIDFSKVKALAGQSLQFFIIQIAAAIVLTSNSVVMSQLFGNEVVTKYNVLFRYFSVIMILQTIILTPIWSAVTDAYLKQDFGWIRSMIAKLTTNSLLLCLVIVAQVVAAPVVFQYWLGNQVTIDYSLLLAIALYMALATFSSAFSYIINGVGTIRLQTLTALCTTFFSIPTALFLGHLWGPAGVVAANCIWLLLFLPLRISQCHRIVTNTAKNIWAK